jgi:hypothetical protein
MKGRSMYSCGAQVNGRGFQVMYAHQIDPVVQACGGVL